MKRVGNLMPRICDPDNLRLAFWRAVRGKWQRDEVRSFSADLNENIRLMRHQLLHGCFPVGSYVRFKIWDPKERVIIGSYAAAPGKGLPIGALTSQHFANFYLGGLDRFVKENLRMRRYARYMDDFVAWSDDKRRLKEAHDAIRCYLSEQLALELKANTLMNRTVHGMDFLGYRLWPFRTRLTRRNRQRLSRRVRAYDRALESGRMTEHDYQQRVGSIAAFVDETGSHADRWRLFPRAEGGVQAA